MVLLSQYNYYAAFLNYILSRKQIQNFFHNILKVQHTVNLRNQQNVYKYIYSLKITELT